MPTNAGDRKPETPQPRYTKIWDVQQVLDYLVKMPNYDQLNLSSLTLKVTGLLALTQINRGSELKNLDIRFMKKINDSYIFSFNKPSKNSKKGCLPPDMKFPAYTEEEKLSSNERKLCPFTAIEYYLQRTTNLRGNMTKTQFLIGQIKPHNQVAKSTIAGWLKLLLSKSGIDTNIYKAHSYRSATSSKAFLTGLSIDDILKHGNWSKASVWQKFYNKPTLDKTSAYQNRVFLKK